MAHDACFARSLRVTEIHLFISLQGETGKIGMPGYPGSDGIPVRSGMKYSNIYLTEINTQTKQPEKWKECPKLERVKN